MKNEAGNLGTIINPPPAFGLINIDFKILDWRKEGKSGTQGVLFENYWQPGGVSACKESCWWNKERYCASRDMFNCR
jgi:hypothetical protein